MKAFRSNACQLLVNRKLDRVLSVILSQSRMAAAQINTDSESSAVLADDMKSKPR